MKAKTTTKKTILCSQASTLCWSDLPSGMCFYQNFCTLPFYMDIAFLCLMEYKTFLNCVLILFVNRFVIFVIFIFSFLDIPEILSQSENDSSDELNCEYSVWHHSQWTAVVFNVIVVVSMVETISTLVVFYVLAVFCQEYWLYNDDILFVYVWIFLTWYTVIGCTHNDVHL